MVYREVIDFSSLVGHTCRIHGGIGVVLAYWGAEKHESGAPWGRELEPLAPPRMLEAQRYPALQALPVLLPSPSGPETTARPDGGRKQARFPKRIRAIRRPTG